MPTKHSTQHIPHSVLPEGGVNELGQMKVTDADGVIRFIDMKKPRVLSPQGIPVKP